ncbi:MAG: hypothetical protein DHS20C14_02340 [Phycisphaeraceae bacterium]|nr:MAG: hypothetical protein DHS20C14_02340 [Phycisphaeraceae bacterium]
MTPVPIEDWADRLEAAIARTPGCCVDQVVVIAETASTQDAALAHAGARPGLLVVAGRQTAGRGQHGRAWEDTADAGLAMTFALPDDGRESAELAAIGGIAARDAVSRVAPGAVLRLKRPNDVLAVGPDGVARKIAGVLIERRGGLTLIGVGINVAQRAWAGDLGDRAVSLAQLGVAADRIDVAEVLVGAMSVAITLDARAIEVRWGS